MGKKTKPVILSPRRRREGKTDYGKRRALIMSKRPFVTVRISGRNTVVQINRIGITGDRTLASAHSRELTKYGWKGPGKNLPAAYLTGFLAGLKAVKAEIASAIMYMGVKSFVKGSRAAAAQKGLADAGINIPGDDSAFPADGRIRGEHIADYAKQVSGADKDLYRRRFSNLLKNSFEPLDYPAHFDKVKAKIMKSLGKGSR